MASNAEDIDPTLAASLTTVPLEQLEADFAAVYDAPDAAAALDGDDAEDEDGMPNTQESFRMALLQSFRDVGLHIARPYSHDNKGLWASLVQKMEDW